MSYDVHLEIDGGAGEPVEAFWRNHTSNTATMWREVGCDIANFDGRSAVDFGASLSGAIEDMTERPGFYARWEPDNGWGSVETTIAFLADLRGACERFPAATVRVSR